MSVLGPPLFEIFQKNSLYTRTFDPHILKSNLLFQLLLAFIVYWYIGWNWCMQEAYRCFPRIPRFQYMKIDSLRISFRSSICLVWFHLTRVSFFLCYQYLFTFVMNLIFYYQKNYCFGSKKGSLMRSLQSEIKTILIKQISDIQCTNSACYLDKSFCLLSLLLSSDDSEYLK